MNKIIINYRTSRFFLVHIVLLGYFFIFIGMIILTKYQILIGILLMVFGCFFAFSSNGVVFDLKGKKFKSYSSLFGLLKVGKWKDLDSFRYVSILRFSQRHKLTSRSFINHSYTEKVFRVMLLNENHHNKILIKQFKKEKKAKDFINKISKELNLNIVKFNPN